MKRLLALTAILTLGIPAAYATGDKPDCHGSNEEECREDPNESGQDCDAHGNNPDGNDDHCATTTTTVPVTVITEPTTTTTTVAATTTTAAPTTTTTIAATVTPEPGAEVGGVTELREVPPEETLPRTGGPAASLVTLGLAGCVLGALASYAGRTRRA